MPLGDAQFCLSCVKNRLAPRVQRPVETVGLPLCHTLLLRIFRLQLFEQGYDGLRRQPRHVLAENSPEPCMMPESAVRTSSLTGTFALTQRVRQKPHLAGRPGQRLAAPVLQLEHGPLRRPYRELVAQDQGRRRVREQHRRDIAQLGSHRHLAERTARIRGARLDREHKHARRPPPPRRPARRVSCHPQRRQPARASHPVQQRALRTRRQPYRLRHQRVVARIPGVGAGDGDRVRDLGGCHTSLVQGSGAGLCGEVDGIAAEEGVEVCSSGRRGAEEEGRVGEKNAGTRGDARSAVDGEEFAEIGGAGAVP